MSLVSETVNDAVDVYCVCRGSYNNKFMVGCDGCDEWFHGSCISMNSDEVKLVEKYFCPFCVEKDQSLKTIYKPGPKDRDKAKTHDHDRPKKKEHRKSKHHDIEDFSRRPKIELTKKKPEQKFHFHKKPKSDDTEGSSKTPKEETTKHTPPKEIPEPIKSQSPKEEKEENIREKPRETSPNKELKKKKEEDKEKSNEVVKKEKKFAKPLAVEEAEGDEEDDVDFNMFLTSIASKPPPPHSSEDEDVDVEVESTAIEDMRIPAKPSKAAAPLQAGKVNRKKGRAKKIRISSQHNPDKIHVEHSSSEEETQCIGPGCCRASRRTSRYCTDDCGVKLAMKRIKTFLPERKEDMKRGSVARKYDEALIRDLELQQTIAHQKVDELQKLRLVVMRLVDKARAALVEGGSDEDMSDEELENEGIDCVTCGMACSDKTALKHMERCYSKYESQLSLGSTVKCGITWESPVCDAYDRQQGAYCKKLKVLCPDHNKEKEEHDGICGCPLDMSDITEDSVVCIRSKRGCSRHISWEKLRLAEIDMERVQQCLKLEESFDEMRKVKYRMANRTNLLQILLNGTIYHGPVDAH